jgi:hypothetical protein
LIKINLKRQNAVSMLKVVSILLVVGMVLTACGATSRPPLAKASVKRQPVVSTTIATSACTSAELTLALKPHGVATGTRVFTGTFENVSSRRCALGSGYVGVQLIGSNGKALATTDTLLNSDGQPIITTAPTTAVTEKGSSKGMSKEIVLAPGGLASFLLTMGDGSSLTPPPYVSHVFACPVAHQVKITLPELPGVPKQSILAVAPPDMVAYPYRDGQPCGGVSISALSPGGPHHILDS